MCNPLNSPFRSIKDSIPRENTKENTDIHTLHVRVLTIKILIH